VVQVKISELTSEAFSSIPDPRARNARHLLNEIFFISLCVVISGAESREDIELYGKSKHSRFKGFLRIPHGIPSDDTYRRVFSSIDTYAFESCFQTWVRSLVDHFNLDVIPVDGETLRNPRSTWSVPGRSLIKWFQGGSKLTANPTRSQRSRIFFKCLTSPGISPALTLWERKKKIARQIIDQEGDYVPALKKITKFFIGILHFISKKPKNTLNRLLNFFMKRLTADTDVLKPVVIISLPISTG